MNKVQITDRQKILFGGAVVLGVVIFFLYGLFMAPHVRHYSALSARYASAAMLLQTRAVKMESLSRLRGETMTRAAKAGDIENRFLGEGGVYLFLKELAHMAEETGNKLKTLEPVKESRSGTKIEGAEKKSIKMAMTGSYSSILEFFYRLASGETMAVVEELRIKNIKASKGQLNVSFKLAVFIL